METCDEQLGLVLLVGGEQYIVARYAVGFCCIIYKGFLTRTMAKRVERSECLFLNDKPDICVELRYTC
ncbi:hypothetical protein Plhal703r1_c30g0118491 [Plasmopara halstedii]